MEIVIRPSTLPAIKLPLLYFSSNHLFCSILSYTAEGLCSVFGRKEGRKEMFHLTTHSTHFIYGYVASDVIMVKDHSDSERGNPLSTLHGLLF